MISSNSGKALDSCDMLFGEAIGAIEGEDRGSPLSGVPIPAYDQTQRIDHTLCQDQTFRRFRRIARIQALTIF